MCGKICKGKRGLKAHQRTCQAHKLLTDNYINNTENDFENELQNSDIIQTDTKNEKPNSEVIVTYKPGLKLPKSRDRWDEANAYFCTVFNMSTPINDLDEYVLSAQSKVYQYFADLYGVINQNSKKLEVKYGNESVKSLKKILKNLKKRKSDVAEIKYVAKMIRTAINKGKPIDDSLEQNLKQNFWRTCKAIFDKAMNTIPTFSINKCEEYFQIVSSDSSELSPFQVPYWVPKLPEPTHPWKENVPSYKEVSTAIKRAKTRGSACPFDQLTIIILKNCAILRTLLHQIVIECWNRKKNPKCWKQGATILIYKKGDTSDPSNFRPITLQPVWYKIFSSILKQRMFNFLSDNKYLDKNIQKGFWPRIDGVTEHNELLTHLILDSRKHTRSLIITLLDLKNAFGEVNHNLIRSTLTYHHLPVFVNEIFNSIYQNSIISVVANGVWSKEIKIGKGVLQGDPLSPLLFNLCFNTLMKTLDKPELKQLGYVWGPENNRCQWLQFADDAVIVSDSVGNSQKLIEIFSAWCQWAKMTIRLDKCTTFGMLKQKGKFNQIEPGLFLKNEKIPTVKLGKSFSYLGKVYDFSMNNNIAKEEIAKKLNELLKITSSLNIKAQTKLRVLKLFIHSQLKFELRLYHLGGTWIDQNLDAACVRHVRNWLQLPISSNIRDPLALPKKFIGLEIPSFKMQAESLWLNKRVSMKNSNDPVIQKIWANTTEKNINSDELIHKHKNIKESLKMLKLQHINHSKNQLYILEIQGMAVKMIVDNISKGNILNWTNMLNQMPESIFCFARKALQQQLPTAANLARWKRIVNPSCILCHSDKPQTNKHVLSNCESPVALKRYTNRHDQILEAMVNWLKISKNDSQSIVADLKCEGSVPVSDIFEDCYRPDICIIDSKSVYVLELTVCHETNLIKSKQYKMNKYENLKNSLRPKHQHRNVFVFTWEVTTLGFVSDLQDFTKSLRFPNVPKEIINSITKIALIQSFEIYCKRNKTTD